MPTQTIAARYQVDRPIGKGGMGTVWLARDQRLGRDVAVKQIGLMPGESAPDLARAMREARLSAVLNHPNVVSVYDVVEEDDGIWLVMEHVPSRTLWQIITQDGPLAPEEAVAIGAQVAQGLAAAHAAGTIHRDVKPGNILVTADHVAKISDFGIARTHDQGHLTRTGVVIGTPEYFSPELARGDDPTPAGDVWALGATLYAAVEGHAPYPDHGNALALLARIGTTPPPRPERAAFLTEPIGRMLDPDPSSRWSMRDAANVLRRLAKQHPVDATRESTSAHPGRAAGLMALVAAPAAAEAPDPEPSPESVAPVALHDQDPSYASGRDHDRSPGRRLLLVGILGLLMLAALGGYLLLRDGVQAPSATTGHHDSTRSPRAHRSSGAGPSAQPRRSSTPAPSQGSTPSPQSGAGTGSPPVTGTRAVTGASAPQFVRNYYAVLPSDTALAWSALSSGFQARIGGYGSYRGFWSTISSVSVTRTAPAGSNAVDASLTYRTNDGHVDTEVRRLYLERSEGHYVITGDAVLK